MNRRELLTLALHSLAISGGVLLLYLATLAPTVLWGDDAEFQRLAFTGRVGAGVRSYPLWVAVAHSLSRWLPAEAAWSANLVSALCAALVVGVLFVLVSGLTHSRPAGWVAGLALAFSHTFWLHAVRAEVYTLFLLGYVLVLALLWGWRLRPAGGQRARLRGNWGWCACAMWAWGWVFGVTSSCFCCRWGYGGRGGSGGQTGRGRFFWGCCGGAASSLPSRSG